MLKLEKIIDFFIETESLKKTLRYSTCPEYVRDRSADHSWKAAFIALVISEEVKGIDSQRAVQLLLVHDLAESITGDIDAYRIKLGEITKSEKQRTEEDAMASIKEKLPAGSFLYNLWKEYEEGATEESKYARALDKIETLIHLLSVNFASEKDDQRAELVAKYADEAVNAFPPLKPLLEAVKGRIRAMFKEKGFQWKEHYEI
ncbi:MAG: hypothetical protein A2427_01105 [Candidatus Nealsonbacteria bacterium RIFOXYC1_FULL_40_7]|uniref:HD domain-containing protein n=1 Tax=Candidatus Nealsonbacteria bacterium RIFOXYC1_FULL_40_7 TaxID=1801678 RepID=A0A1G2ERD6_9BACT|nr:MAG: hypothetical protein A2427_01105 [Candidatus Nealsonbacteria bacterium RIFOXYC1_FULL_40_7]